MPTKTRSAPPGGRLVAATVVAVAVLPLALARADPDPSPDLASQVVDGEVHAIAHANGTTYIGGEFSHVGPRVGHGVELRADGAEVDPTWPQLGAPSFPEVSGGEVRAVVSDEHGGWYIGGEFTHVGGEPRSRIAHIRPDGTLDPWAPDIRCDTFATCIDGAVRALVYDDEGATPALYVGGSFDKIGSLSRKHLIAFKVNPTTGAPASPGNDAQGNERPATFPIAWNPDPDGWVEALDVVVVPVNVSGAPTPTNVPYVLAAGRFTQIGQATQATTRIAVVGGIGAVNVDGTSTAATGYGTISGGAGAINAIAAGTSVVSGDFRDLALYVGGDFTGLAGSRNRLAAVRVQIRVPRRRHRSRDHRLQHHQRSVDTQSRSTGHRPRDVRRRADRVRGWGILKYRPAIGGATQPRGARGDPRGAGLEHKLWVNCRATPQEWDPSPDGAVQSLASAGELVYVGGEFTEVGAPPGRLTRNGLAAVAANGQPAGGQATGWDPRAAGGAVKALDVDDVDSDGVYAGGALNSVGAEERGNLAALRPDGALDPSWRPSSNGPIDALEISSDGGTVYAGGSFTALGPETSLTPRRRAGALDAASGALIEGWDPEVTSICVPPEDGCDEPPTAVTAIDATNLAVYLGGAFTHVGGAERRGIAAVDPVGGDPTGWDPDANAPPGDPDAPAQVHALEATCDVVYAGGNFTRIGAPAGGVQPQRGRIAALDGGSGAATPWDPNANGAVHTLAVRGGTVFAGGSFNTIGGTLRQRIGALEANGFGSGAGSALGWNPSADGTVRALAVGEGGEAVYAGGSFAAIGGAPRTRLAALEGPAIGNGHGDATGWDPDPNATVEALATSADRVYAGGSFTEMGARAQSGVAPFSGGEAASAPTQQCAPPQTGAATVPPSTDPPPADVPGSPLPAPPPPQPPIDLPACPTELRGTRKGERLKGTEAGERIVSRGGNDRVEAGPGDDCVDGGRGNDRISGDSGADLLEGASGSDKLTGGGGEDEILGGAGDDTVLARRGGRDRVNCGPGRDRAKVDPRDRVRGCERTLEERGE